MLFPGCPPMSLQQDCKRWIKYIKHVMSSGQLAKLSVCASVRQSVSFYTCLRVPSLPACLLLLKCVCLHANACMFSCVPFTLLAWICFRAFVQWMYVCLPASRSLPLCMWSFAHSIPPPSFLHSCIHVSIIWAVKIHCPSSRQGPSLFGPHLYAPNPSWSIERAHKFYRDLVEWWDLLLMFQLRFLGQL